MTRVEMMNLSDAKLQEIAGKKRPDGLPTKEALKAQKILKDRARR